MSKNLKLYPHNLEGYQKVKEAYDNGERVAGIVHATGTGKSYIFLQLCLDNPDKKTLFVAPSNAIIEHILETIKECGLSLENDFPNLQFTTYQALTNMSDKELELLNIDALALDEFHHIGAPVWGEQVNKIVDSHPNMKVFGMTAYTLRDRGTAYERDMALPGGNELFSDKIVSTYDIYDAMCDGVLPIPNYKSAYLNLLGEAKELEEFVLNSEKLSKEDKELYLKIINSCKEQIDKAPTAKELIRDNFKSSDKCIYFCPVNDAVILKDDEILGTNDVPSIRRRVGQLAVEVSGKTILYETTSDMGEAGRMNRAHFYNDTSFFRNEDVSDILRIMFAKNQYNEGVHAPGVTKVFLGRQTKSDIVFFEQIGRALSVKGNIVELTKEYESNTIEELVSLANTQSIDISRCITKEAIIERLLAPTIVDLVGNIEFIRELKDNLKERIKERQEKGIPTKITRELVDVAFDITIENEDIYGILEDLRERIFVPLSIEQKLSEIITLYKKTGEMPNTGCRERFSNGSLIGRWLWRNKTNIIELYKKEDESAQLVVEKLGWHEEKIELSTVAKLEEIVTIYNKTGIMPNTESKEKFSNGSLIGRWLSSYKYLVIDSFKNGNPNAQLIIEKLGWNEDKLNKGIQEIVAIYNKTGIMPNSNCKERFKTGKMMMIGSFLISNKDKIEALAEEGNPDAQLIVEKLGWIQKKIKLSFKDKLSEIINIYNKKSIIPNSVSTEIFSDGTRIGFWLINHKDEIMKLAKNGDLEAKFIVEKLRWNEEKIELSTNDRLREIVAIYNKTGEMPNTHCQEKFSNGCVIGYWLSDHSYEIKELDENGNPDAHLIMEKLGRNEEKTDLPFVDRLKEIIKIYKETGKMPIRVKNKSIEKVFSNGTAIGPWLENKKNRDKIIELAQQGNLDAQFIVEKMGWNEEKIYLSIDDRLKEIMALYNKTGIMPNRKCKEKFSNGKVIGFWLIRAKDDIIASANQGNEFAQLILETLDKKKNISNIEQLCNEYSINYKKNKKFVDNLSASIFSALLNYFIDNNISYVDSDGLLIGDIFMSSKDFESKYGISIIELLNKEKRK